MNLSLWCNRIIRFSFYLLLILVPLILTPWNYELFEYNKMMLTYILTVVIGASWIVKMIAEREVRIAKTPLDIPIALFFSSQLVSSLFSMDAHVSWFGYYSRFNGGMFSVVSYTILYYAFVTNIKEVLSFLRVALVSAVVVALYGVAERLGIDKHLWVQDVQTRVFSTLGQPNWLAAYLVALSPIAWALALKSQISKFKTQNNIKIQNSNFEFILDFGFWIWTVVSILFFLTLLFTRSRSGLLGLAVADIVLWVSVFLIAGKNRKTYFPSFIICHLAFGIIVFFNGSYIAQIDKYFTLAGIIKMFSKQTAPAAQNPVTPAGPALEMGGTESGTIRKYVWQGAVNAWKSSPKNLLIGTGTETFAFAFYQYRPKGHNLTSEWDFLYNKAHNEYLNYLATTGIFGLGSYLLFLGVFVVWFIKQFLISNSLISKQIPMSKSQLGQLDQLEIRSIMFALFAGWFSILITNFFGFSVVITQIFLFLFPAMIVVLYSQQYRQFKLRVPHPTFVIGMTIVMAITVCGIVFSHWYADTLYATAYRTARSGAYAKAKLIMDQAVALNPLEPVYHDEIATTLAALAVGASEQKDATATAQFAKQALEQSDRSIQFSPHNVNFWKTRTKIYYSLSGLDPLLNQAAIRALEKSGELSPNDPKVYYNLAILYGRDGDAKKAIAMLTKAIDLKGDYRDAYYALYVFYGETGNSEAGRAILQEFLSNVNPNDSQFNELVGTKKTQ